MTDDAQRIERLIKDLRSGRNELSARMEAADLIAAMASVGARQETELDRLRVDAERMRALIRDAGADDGPLGMASLYLYLEIDDENEDRSIPDALEAMRHKLRAEAATAPIRAEDGRG